MSLKLAFVTTIVALLPAVASAMCSGKQHLQSTSQCTQGQNWDPNTQACVPVVNS
jgi:hypothetical protein